jgi:hypothetical protein
MQTFSRTQNILSCNFTELGLPLEALLVRVSDGVHYHLCVQACAIAIDFVGELVVNKKESHEVASDSNTI